MVLIGWNSDFHDQRFLTFVIKTSLMGRGEWFKLKGKYRTEAT
jgi:hypothetical protein